MLFLKKYQKRNKQQKALIQLFGKVYLLIAVLPLLNACEAQLNLEGVNTELEKSSLRTDQYQEMLLNNGIITLVGGHGLVMTSSNQGENWQRQIVNGNPEFIGLTSCPDNSLLALSFDRKIWISTDNGKQWLAKSIPTREDVMDITCAPDGSYWVTGSFSTLLHSQDLGDSWQENSFDEDALLTHIIFFDENTAITVGEFGLFFKTADSGKSWQSVGIIGEELYPLAIHFKDLDTGWAGGLSGIIMKTSDGGASWSTQTTAVKSPIYRFIQDGQNLYAIGDHSTVLKLKNDQWVRLESPTIPVYLSTGLVLDNKNLLVAGGWGTMFSVPVETLKN
jgi:photosystem II stability/assembly factor-like uncharacterized protein